MKRIQIAVGVMVLLLCSGFGHAQQTVATNTNVVVPPLVNFSGVLTEVNGKPLTGVVGVTFLLYKDSQGGSPLWMETQNVQPDNTGHYTVMLGSTSSTGLPSDIFIAGEAHWLGVQAQGQDEQPRVLLVSAPYALKAGDAQTIGGLPPSAFVLAAPPSNSASGGSTLQTSAPANASTASAPPPASSDVTTTGGTVATIAAFSTATNIQSSLLSQTARTTINVAGKFNLPATGTATASAGRNSQPQDFVASAFDSTTSTAVPQTFQWQAEPVGNDTATASGTLNLMFFSGTTKPAETGLNIANNGQITFAKNQTFPGTGTITGITTASASGLTGGGTSGTLSLGLTEACAANQVLQWNGSAWACSSAGTGTITGVTAGTDLTGGGTSGNVTLNLNTTATNALYAQLAVANTFAPQQAIKGNGGNAIIGDPACGSGFSGIGLTSSTLSGCNNYTMIGKSTGDVYLNSTSTGSIHFRNGNSGSNTYNDLATIDNSGNLTAAGTVQGASVNVAVHGESSGASKTGGINSPSGAGVWGDTAAGTCGGLCVFTGVFGTADDGEGGDFENNSADDFAALLALNHSTTSGSLAFAAGGTSGFAGAICTIDIDANLTCSGTVNGAVSADGGARKVSLYAMQSPENWFEDAGSGQLSNGSAAIAFDPTFAQTVNAGVQYHVFLTPKGDCEGLYVSNETPQGFEVHELRGGRSSIAFDFRIMAKRVGYENVRLADVTDQYKKMQQQQQLRRERMAQRRAARSSAEPIATAAIAAHK